MKSVALMFVVIGACHSVMAKDTRNAAPENEISWEYIAPGVYEGVRGTETLRSFQGKEGFGVFLSEKRKELRKVETLGGEINNHALSRLVNDLEDIYSKSSQLGDIGLAKATQVVQLLPHIPQLCGWLNAGESIFMSNQWAMWDYPRVEAKSPGWGQTLQIGSFPPPPLATFRSVYAELTGWGLPIALSDYDSSTLNNAAIEARVEEWGVNDCHMETVHVYSATCSSSVVESAIVTIDQYCESVWSDLPPFIVVD